MTCGITGHQVIEKKHVEWIVRSIVEIIEKEGVTHGFSSLSIGADQIFAEVLVAKEIPFTAVIPCKAYASTFSEPMHIRKYTMLLEKAAAVVLLDFSDPSEVVFFEAGKTIAGISDFMIAVWDGKPARGLGGTGDVVDYSLQIGKRIIHLNPEHQSVVNLTGKSD